MDLPFGVSWLCTLLLWGCISFPSQKGYNIAHGYSLSESPQTSNQFHSGAFLNTNPEDEPQVMRQQSFVSLQRQPVHHENGEDVSSATSLGEDMVQHKPDSGQEQDEFLVVTSTPVPKYEHLSSGYQHPFGLLVKEHTPKKTVEGITFPTIKDFRRFIETMKSSFLTPGSDLSRHFQTARETVKTELTSGAQNINGESSSGSAYVKGSAHDDNTKNEIWSEPMNTVFEQSEPDANYQMPSESFSFPDLDDSTASLITSSVYGDQDSGPGSTVYQQHNLATTEHVSSNSGSLANGGISGENPDVFTSAANVQNEDEQATSYKLPEQIASGSFFGGDFSFSSHVTASPINSPNSPSQDISYYSSKISSIKPLTPEKNIQQPKYSSHSGDSLTGNQKPSGGFEPGKDFQGEVLRKEAEADVLSLQKTPSLNSYGKSIYVSAPRGQLHIPDNLPKRRERPAQSVQTYQPTVGKESKNIDYTAAIHLPVTTDSVSSNSDLSPQVVSGHVGVEAGGQRDPQHQAFSRKQPVNSHLVFSVKPSSSLHDSSRHDGYLRNQRVSVSHPPIPTAQAKDEEKSDLSKQNLVSAIQEPKNMNDSTLIPNSSGIDSTQNGISSQVSDVYTSFNSQTNSAPTSEPKRAFSRLFGNEVMSRNSEIKKIISDRFPHGARNLLGSFSTQQRQGISLNDGFVSAMRAGLLRTFIQPTKVQKHPDKNKEPSNMTYRPSKPLFASKMSGSTLNGVFWRNGGSSKRLPPQMGPNLSPPFVTAYVMKSRNGYVRGKVSLSKTSYTPYQHVEGWTDKDQWKPVPRQQKAPVYRTM